jgi:FkbM family methyltransferase
MGVLRKAVNVVDRPGSRWALAAGASALAGQSLSIRYRDGYWLYSAEGMTLPRGPKFDFYGWDLRNLASQVRHYINETQDCWLREYKPQAGDVVVDVGAELGTDAVIFSRAVGNSGRVIAIEAQPETFGLLLQTISANNLANVEPIHLAVADKPGEVRISSDAGVQANHLGDEGVPVKADTLDNILADVPRIDLLKMNIEGAEQLAIKGMDETIRKTARVSIACHDFVADQTGNNWFRTLDKVTDYLTSKGFTVSRREDDPREYARFHVHAVKANS